ncbi:ergothioneine biosynthesis protein EgtC [Streptomyces johnsoniae]|uniref:Gamma-glutamyl-hercynylcysteine sulfoxide hydrolase n=1 Tax=Streptomyces johnsoniae TaxID=3075532 RepID=A0ABU2RYH2_9ACTN|nr:ergothioneine biosynthesis protein EgtC [Streptomyces sp. DSM 41886]MDT0441792.1 ergothioneine biosynthesis protein EgtC [Streptomyces sp. DSM 41886]
MCRHLAYLGPARPLAEVLTDPPHSLYRQSWTPSVNADGFGVGWYPPENGAGPVRYRRAVPIWSDANLPGLAAVLRSGAVLAAVRSATPGTSHDEAASAPFALGRWLFSHNGAVPRWELLPADTGEPLTAAELLGLDARSDSALLWAMTGRRLTAGLPPGEALADIVRTTAAARPDARLNLLLTDGSTIAATRHGDTLWYRRRDETEVTVASSPVPGERGWHEVPEHSLLLAGRTTTDVEPL